MRLVLIASVTFALFTPGVVAAQSNTPSLGSLVERIIEFHETGEISWPEPAERELVVVECTFTRFAREAQRLGDSPGERVSTVENGLHRRAVATELRVSEGNPELTEKRIFPGDPLVLRVEDLLEQTPEQVTVLLTYSFNVYPRMAPRATGWAQWQVSWSWKGGEWIEERREPIRKGFRLEDGC